MTPMTMLTWTGRRHRAADVRLCPEKAMRGNSILTAACDPNLLALASWQDWGPPVTGRPTHTSDCNTCFPVPVEAVQ